MPDEQIVQKTSDPQREKDAEKMKAFRELEDMIKKGTVTDYEAELAAYRDDKFGLQDID